MADDIKEYGVRDLATKLVAALEACEPGINDAFTFAAIHGQRYSGPTYGKELEALKAALVVEK